MIRLYILSSVLLFACATSSQGMNRFDLVQMKQTGVIETIVRDTLCGGLIVPAITAAAITLLVDNRETYASVKFLEQLLVGSVIIGTQFLMASCSEAFGIRQSNPTGLARTWRERYKLACGIFAICAVLKSEFLLKKCI